MSNDDLLKALLIDNIAKLQSMKPIFWALIRGLEPAKYAKENYRLFFEFYLNEIENVYSMLQLSSPEKHVMNKILEAEIQEAKQRLENPYFDRPDLNFQVLEEERLNLYPEND